MNKTLIATEKDGSQWMSLDDVHGLLGEFYSLSCAGITESPNEIVKTKFQEIAAKCIEHGFVRPTPRAAELAKVVPQFGATSNCSICHKRIIFSGEGVWLHCASQKHGSARCNGAIANPPIR